MYPLKWKVLNFSVVLTGSLRSFSLKLMTKLIELVSISGTLFVTRIVLGRLALDNVL